MKVDAHDLLRAMANGLNYNYTIAREPFDQLCRFDYGLRQALDEHFDFRSFGRLLLEKVPPETLIMTEDELNCYYVLLKLPDAPDEVHILGPVLNKIPLSESLYQEVQTRFGEAALNELKNYFKNIRIADGLDAIALLTSLYTAVYPHANLKCVETPRFFPVPLARPALDVMARENMEHMSEDVIKERYLREERLVSAVASGDSKSAIFHINSLARYAISEGTSSPLRDVKNHVLNINVLCKMAVASTKTVHPCYVEQIYLDYMARAEGILSNREAKRLIGQMVLDYCECIHSHSLESLSPQIQRVVDHIHMHLQENMSLKFFAQMCNMSASYLSNLFREETGVTLTEYINRLRIERASVWLRLSDESIAKIGERVGFLDENYFTRVFKRIKGVPPSVYRRTANASSGNRPLTFHEQLP